MRVSLLLFLWLARGIEVVRQRKSNKHTPNAKPQSSPKLSEECGVCRNATARAFGAYIGARQRVTRAEQSAAAIAALDAACADYPAASRRAALCEKLMLEHDGAIEAGLAALETAGVVDHASLPVFRRRVCVERAKACSSFAPFEVWSPTIAPNGTIPREHTCDGANEPPALAWAGAPARTRAFALALELISTRAPPRVEPDYHGADGPGLWVLWDVPAETRALPRTRVGHRLSELDAALSGVVVGLPDHPGVGGYNGPCPPRAADTVRCSRRRPGGRAARRRRRRAPRRARRAGGRRACAGARAFRRAHPTAPRGRGRRRRGNRARPAAARAWR